MAPLYKFGQRGGLRKSGQLPTVTTETGSTRFVREPAITNPRARLDGMGRLVYRHLPRHARFVVQTWYMHHNAFCERWHAMVAVACMSLWVLATAVAIRRRNSRPTECLHCSACVVIGVAAEARSNRDLFVQHGGVEAYALLDLRITRQCAIYGVLALYRVGAPMASGPSALSTAPPGPSSSLCRFRYQICFVVCLWSSQSGARRCCTLVQPPFGLFGVRSASLLPSRRCSEKTLGGKRWGHEGCGEG